MALPLSGGKLNWNLVGANFDVPLSTKKAKIGPSVPKTFKALFELFVTSGGQ